MGVRRPPCLIACSDLYMRSAHDADYRTAKKDWDSFCESLTEKIIEKDDTIPELPVKDVVRRAHGSCWLWLTRSRSSASIAMLGLAKTLHRTRYL